MKKTPLDVELPYYKLTELADIWQVPVHRILSIGSYSIRTCIAPILGSRVRNGEILKPGICSGEFIIPPQYLMQLAQHGRVTVCHLIEGIWDRRAQHWRPNCPGLNLTIDDLYVLRKDKEDIEKLLNQSASKAPNKDGDKHDKSVNRLTGSASASVAESIIERDARLRASVFALIEGGLLKKAACRIVAAEEVGNSNIGFERLRRIAQKRR